MGCPHPHPHPLVLLLFRAVPVAGRTIFQTRIPRMRTYPRHVARTRVTTRPRLSARIRSSGRGPYSPRVPPAFLPRAVRRLPVRESRDYQRKSCRAPARVYKPRGLDAGQAN